MPIGQRRFGRNEKRHTRNHIVVRMDYLGPLTCWKCKEKFPQEMFKELKYYVPIQRGIPVKMYVPKCHHCRANMRSKWAAHPLYNARVEEFMNFLRTRQGSTATNRNIAFLLETDDLVGLYLEQGGKCALSGIEMMIETGTNGARNWYVASIDRIDSSGNYELGNVQLTCSAVNMMKSEMTNSQFVNFARKVVEHHADKMDELENAIMAKTS